MIKEFHRGDIFFAEKFYAVGSEQNGMRPYLIISNNSNNKFATTLTAIPLTTQEKKSLPTHYTISINGVKCTILAEQITCLEKCQCEKLIRHLTDEEMKEVEKIVRVQLALSETTRNVYIYEHDNKVRRLLRKIFKPREKKPKKLSKAAKKKILSEEFENIFEKL